MTNPLTAIKEGFLKALWPVFKAVGIAQLASQDFAETSFNALPAGIQRTTSVDEIQAWVKATLAIFTPNTVAAVDEHVGVVA